MYGYGGRANVGSRESAAEVAKRILRVNEAAEPPNARWRWNVGDASMWSEQGQEKGVSIASVMRDAGLRLRRGPRMHGSRLSTLQLLVNGLRNKTFFVARGCRHWLRTVPVIAPDPDHPEDVDTEAEDHSIDMTRYGLWAWHTTRAAEDAPDAKKGPRIVPPKILPSKRDPLTGKPVSTGEDLLRIMAGENVS